MAKMDNRKNLKIKEETAKRLKMLQAKIKLNQGIEKSLTDLTDEILNVPAFKKVEEDLLKKKLKFDVKIRFD